MYPPLFSRYWRHITLLFFAVASLVILLAVPPIRQDTRYHDFADKRSFLGIPNFADVISNLPFLFIGLAGLTLGLRHKLVGFSASWFAFFFGVTMVSVGSGYYHWRPCNDTLVWDRLPMTVGFMGMFVALVSESIHQRLEHFLLVPALILGLSSVIYWQMADDLRFYAWVQYAPLVMIPVLLALFQSRYSYRWLLLLAFGCYLLAKVFEAFDREIFAASKSLVGGHAIKHLWAATGCLAILEMLRRRKCIKPDNAA